MVTGFWQVFALLGHLGFATVLTVWPNDFDRHPGLIRAIGILGLITFAPYDNPEISIASVIELAGSGTSTADITASIIDYYYSNNTDEAPAQDTGTLLN